jgi:hypothetical protein
MNPWNLSEGNRTIVISLIGCKLAQLIAGQRYYDAHSRGTNSMGVFAVRRTYLPPV